MSELQGKWNYQSFVSIPAIVDTSKPLPPNELRAALIAAPWTKPSVMDFVTDVFGNITGTAQLGPLVFNITGSIKPAESDIPEGIELVVTVTVSSAISIYHLRGYFLQNSDHIVGSVVSISNDLGHQPVGTSGPFVLYPVKV